MESVFVLIVVLIVLGPVVLAVTKGRRSRPPVDDDAKGSTAYGEFVRDILTPPGKH